jgi:hypothetical protein
MCLVLDLVLFVFEMCEAAYRERDKPPQGVMAITLKVILPRAFGFNRVDDMMGIVGCGFGTYTRQYE